MYLHANAKLGLAARFALVQAVEGGCSIRGAARRFNVSPTTAHRWWHRWGARRPRRCRREAVESSVLFEPSSSVGLSRISVAHSAGSMWAEGAVPG
jgi:transposase-like protein